MVEQHALYANLIAYNKGFLVGRLLHTLGTKLTYMLAKTMMTAFQISQIM